MPQGVTKPLDLALRRDSMWHLEGWQLNLLFSQDLAENEIRFRTTRKRPEENSESEFVELKLKNSNSKFASNTIGTIKGCCLQAPPFSKSCWMMLDALVKHGVTNKKLQPKRPGFLPVTSHQKRTWQCREDDVIIHHCHPKIQLRTDAMKG